MAPWSLSLIYLPAFSGLNEQKKLTKQQEIKTVFFLSKEKKFQVSRMKTSLVNAP